MIHFINNLQNNNLVEATAIIESRIKELLEQKIQQLKLDITDEMFNIDFDDELEDDEAEELDEGNITKMGRTKLIRVRIRGGKIQRRKKLSAVQGYTTRGGKLVRMSSIERRHRQMAAKRSKFKRKAKLKQALRKRRMSLRKRQAMGI